MIESESFTAEVFINRRGAIHPREDVYNSVQGGGWGGCEDVYNSVQGGGWRVEGGGCRVSTRSHCLRRRSSADEALCGRLARPLLADLGRKGGGSADAFAAATAAAAASARARATCHRRQLASHTDSWRLTPASRCAWAGERVMPGILHAGVLLARVVH
eukprot:252288-Prorocentrum_minimum.AAC.2